VIPALALAAILAASAHAAPAARVRADAADLTARQRADFIAAVVTLKHTRSPYDRRFNYYDQFVKWHRDLYRCTTGRPQLYAHGGPMFLPWHRSFILAFENALRQVSGKPIVLPYWDWTSARSTHAVFSRKFLGGDGNPDEYRYVTDGAFRRGRFRIRVQPTEPILRDLGRSPWIQRHFASYPGAESLPAPGEVKGALAVSAYDVAPFDNRSDRDRSFRARLEGWDLDASRVQSSRDACVDGWFTIAEGPVGKTHLHGTGHQWVGGVVDKPSGGGGLGTMVSSTSPNDPVFFLHHADVDRIWARWQARHGVRTYNPLSGDPFNEANSTIPLFKRLHLPSTPRAIEASLGRSGIRYARPRSPPNPRALRPGFCRLTS